jgi:hypothetical protein
LSYPKSLQETVENGKRSYSVHVFEVENAVIALFNEKKRILLGTLAIAVPQLDCRDCVSSLLLGDRNAVFTKVLAERLASSFKKMALVSTNLNVNPSKKEIQILTKLLRKIMETDKT